MNILSQDRESELKQAILKAKEAKTFLKHFYNCFNTSLEFSKSNFSDFQLTNPDEDKQKIRELQQIITKLNTIVRNVERLEELNKYQDQTNLCQEQQKPEVIISINIDHTQKDLCLLVEHLKNNQKVSLNNRIHVLRVEKKNKHCFEIFSGKENPFLQTILDYKERYPQHITLNYL